MSSPWHSRICIALIIVDHTQDSYMHFIYQYVVYTIIYWSIYIHLYVSLSISVCVCSVCTPWCEGRLLVSSCRMRRKKTTKEKKGRKKAKKKEKERERLWLIGISRERVSVSFFLTAMGTLSIPRFDILLQTRYKERKKTDKERKKLERDLNHIHWTYTFV